MSHGDRVTRLPDGFTVKATSENAPFAVASDEKRRIYTTMFHPEVVHTPDGAKLLSNFVHKIAGLKNDWTMAHFRTAEVAKIRAQVGKARVISGLSGGVDSAVASVLIHEAIGDQLTCIFVDHGLLRHNEAEEVVRLFRGHYNIPLIHVDARERFLAALAGKSDPEAKRKTIGALFIDVFDEEAKKLGGGSRAGASGADAAPAQFLAQGTLYPDVIESVSFTGGPSVTIKSHHNVGGLPERMNLKLVEPLRELFKDEVRALGRELGLPEHFVGRHPFPGPGLAIRIPGEITEEKLAILRQADAIYLDEIRKAGLYDQIWQAFAVLLPVRTVGVMGDARTYDFVCALRAVTSTDGMTADYYDFPHSFLGPDGDAHHQRGARHQPRRLRHHLQAPRHDRVGVGAATVKPVTIYGIPNCDTMKKARAWLESHGVAYDFHDYKKAGIDRSRLESWSKKVGWETLLNRAGTTFRKLPDADKQGVERDKAIDLMLAQPSLIKRPVLDLGGGKLLVGFKPEIYREALRP